MSEYFDSRLKIGDRGYQIAHVNNGYMLHCPVCGYSIYADYGLAFDHIDAEEKKFPNDE